MGGASSIGARGVERLRAAAAAILLRASSRHISPPLCLFLQSRRKTPKRRGTMRRRRALNSASERTEQTTTTTTRETPLNFLKWSITARMARERSAAARRELAKPHPPNQDGGMESDFFFLWGGAWGGNFLSCSSGNQAILHIRICTGMLHTMSSTVTFE